MQVPAATGFASGCVNLVDVPLNGVRISEESALNMFSTCEMRQTILSPNEVQEWLQFSLRHRFDNLSDRIIRSAASEKTSFKQLIKAGAANNPRVFGFVLDRENFRGAQGPIEFSEELSRHLERICDYEQPDDLLSFSLSIFNQAWKHKNRAKAFLKGPIGRRFREAFLRALSRKQESIVIRLIGVPFWKELGLGNARCDPAFKQRLQEMDVPRQIKKRSSHFRCD